MGLVVSWAKSEALLPRALFILLTKPLIYI